LARKEKAPIDISSAEESQFFSSASITEQKPKLLGYGEPFRFFRHFVYTYKMILTVPEEVLIKPEKLLEQSPYPVSAHCPLYSSVYNNTESLLRFLICLFEEEEMIAPALFFPCSGTEFAFRQTFVLAEGTGH
jgi:hypothetical protein